MYITNPISRGAERNREGGREGRKGCCLKYMNLKLNVFKIQNRVGLAILTKHTNDNSNTCKYPCWFINICPKCSL